MHTHTKTVMMMITIVIFLLMLIGPFTARCSELLLHIGDSFLECSDVHLMAPMQLLKDGQQEKDTGFFVSIEFPPQLTCSATVHDQTGAAVFVFESSADVFGTRLGRAEPIWLSDVDCREHTMYGLKCQIRVSVVQISDQDEQEEEEEEVKIVRYDDRVFNVSFKSASDHELYYQHKLQTRGWFLSNLTDPNSRAPLLTSISKKTHAYTELNILSKLKVLTMQPRFHMSPPVKELYLIDIETSPSIPQGDISMYMFVVEVYDEQARILLDRQTIYPNELKTRTFAFPYYKCDQPVNVVIKLLYDRREPVLVSTEEVPVDASAFCPQGSSSSSKCFCESGCGVYEDTNRDGKTAFLDPDCSILDMFDKNTEPSRDSRIKLPIPETSTATMMMMPMITTTVSSVMESVSGKVNGEEEEEEEGSVLFIKNSIGAYYSCSSTLSASWAVSDKDAEDTPYAGVGHIYVSSSGDSLEWNRDSPDKKWKWSAGVAVNGSADFKWIVMDYTTGRSQMPRSNYTIFLEFGTVYSAQVAVSSLPVMADGRSDDVCFIAMEQMATTSRLQAQVVNPITILSCEYALAFVFNISCASPLVDVYIPDSPTPAFAKAGAWAAAATTGDEVLVIRQFSENHYSGMYFTEVGYFQKSTAADRDLLSRTTFTVVAVSESRAKQTIEVSLLNDAILRNSHQMLSSHIITSTTTTTTTTTVSTGSGYTCGKSDQHATIEVINNSPLRYLVSVDTPDGPVVLKRGRAVEISQVSVTLPSPPLSVFQKTSQTMTVMYDFGEHKISEMIHAKLTDNCRLSQKRSIEVALTAYIPANGSIKVLPVDWEDAYDQEQACAGKRRVQFVMPDGNINDPVHYFTSNDEDLGDSRIYNGAVRYLSTSRQTTISVNTYLSAIGQTSYRLVCNFHISVAPLTRVSNIRMPDITTDVLQSAFYDQNSMAVSLKDADADSYVVFTVVGPQGLVSDASRDMRREVSFSNLVSGTYVVQTESIFYASNNGNKLYSLACKKIDLVQISRKADSQIAESVSQGKEKALCPISKSNKYWSLTLADAFVQKAGAGGNSYSVELWDTLAMRKVELKPIPNSNGRMYSHMITHPGNYTADIVYTIHTHDNNGIASRAVFSTEPYNVKDSDITEDSFDVHFTNPRCIYSSDGVVDISYPPSLSGNILVKMVSCTPLAQGASCSGARMVDNRKITNVPFAKEIVLEFIVSHSCRYTKTVPLLPLSDLYPVLSHIHVMYDCSGKITLLPFLKSGENHGDVALLHNNENYIIKWKANGQYIMGESNPHLIISSPLATVTQYEVSVSTALGCATYATAIVNPVLEDANALFVRESVVLPTYCPGESDASISVETSVDTDIEWTCEHFSSYGSNNNNNNSNHHIEHLEQFKNKKSITNLPPGVYTATVKLTGELTSGCTKSISFEIFPKPDYVVKRHMYHTKQPNEKYTLHISHTQNVKLEFETFSAGMLSSADRAFLPDATHQWPNLQNIPSQHSIVIDMPVPAEYRTYTRRMKCSLPLEYKVVEETVMPVVSFPADLVSIITPASQVLFCPYEKPAPVIVSEMASATKTITRVYKRLNPLLIPGYEVSSPVLLKFRLTPVEWQAIADTMIVKRAYPLHNVTIDAVTLVDPNDPSAIQHPCAETVGTDGEFVCDGSQMPNQQRFDLQIQYNHACSERLSIFRNAVHGKQRLSSSSSSSPSRDIKVAGKSIGSDGTLHILTSKNAHLRMDVYVDSTEASSSSAESSTSAESCYPYSSLLSPWYSICKYSFVAGKLYDLKSEARSGQRNVTVDVQEAERGLEIIATLSFAPTLGSCNGMVTVTVLPGSPPPPYFLTTNRGIDAMQQSDIGKFQITDVCTGLLIVSVRDSLYGVEDWVTASVVVTAGSEFAFLYVAAGVGKGCGLGTVTNVTFSFVDEPPLLAGAWNLLYSPVPISACNDSRMAAPLIGGIDAGSYFYYMPLGVGEWVLYACDGAGSLISYPHAIQLTVQNHPLNVTVVDGELCSATFDVWNHPRLLVRDALPPLTLYNSDSIYINDAVVGNYNNNTVDELEMLVDGLTSAGYTTFWLVDQHECPVEVGIFMNSAAVGECGTCNLTDASCHGCDGRPWSRVVPDICGACGGTSACLSDCEIDGSAPLITQQQLLQEISGCTEITGYNMAIVSLPAVMSNGSSSGGMSTVRNTHFTSSLTVPNSKDVLIEQSTVNGLYLSNTTHFVITDSIMSGSLYMIHAGSCGANYTMNMRLRDVDVNSGFNIHIQATDNNNNNTICTPLNARIRIKFMTVALLNVYSEMDTYFILGDTNITTLAIYGNASYTFLLGDSQYPSHVTHVDINDNGSNEKKEWRKVTACRIMLKSGISVDEVTFDGDFTVRHLQRQCMADYAVVKALNYEDTLPIDYSDDPFDYYGFGTSGSNTTQTKEFDNNFVAIMGIVSVMLMAVLLLYYVGVLRPQQQDNYYYYYTENGKEIRERQT